MVLSMDKWKGKVAVVTGASDGIGASITLSLLKEGLIVVGIARRKEKIQELSNSINLHAVKADLRNEEEILNAFKWITGNIGPIHILINNAGIMRVTDLIQGNSEFWKTTFDINVLALCIATREALKSMKENDINGHIIHINGISGHKVLNIPMFNVAGASKYAVTALTETLRLELNSIGSKVKISSVSPGSTKTDIFNTSLKESGITNPIDMLKEFHKNLSHLNPSDVADAVVYILSTPSHVQVHELIIKPVGEEL
ncbi:hypothetical protein FQA39_LY03749 [Lamprigera yunnana]|nr:hypothetical protein FQA39_LY03749 [Lamprigera yunnana]